MPNEKMMILKMLEEGKISPGEAERLLEAAGREPGGPSRYATGGPQAEPPTAFHEPPQAPSYDAPPSHGGYAPSGHYASNSNNRPHGGGGAPRPASGFDSFAGDLSRRFDAFARELEPRLQKFSETVVEKTASLADRISQSIDDTSRRASPPPPSPQGRSDGQQKRYELFVAPGYNELNLPGLNGDVLIHGYNGDKITASIFCKPKRINAALTLMRLGNKYFLNYDDDDFSKVSIDAYVPENMFNVITISTINGTLDVSTLSADNIALNNSNGQTKLQSLGAGCLEVECNNGRLNIGAVRAKNARVENFNGAIDALDIDSANLKLTSVNGGIVVNMSRFADFPEYMWDVESSNGKMTLNLPTYPDLGYHVKAHTSLGQIRVGLTNLSFIQNSPSLTEAKSIHFDGAAKKVKLALETSNAPLQIN